MRDQPVVSFKQVRGSSFGITGPQLMFQIDLQSKKDLLVSQSGLTQALQGCWPTLNGIATGSSEESATCFIQTLQRVANVVLSEIGNYPITDCRLLGLSPDYLGFTGSMACPMSDFSLAQGMVTWLLNVYDTCKRKKDKADLSKQFNQLQARAAGLLASTSNTRLFLKAAHELGIPFRHLGGNLFQFGIGRRARLLDSSISDQTPWLGVMIAKNKPFCSSMLRMAGFPAPPHKLVSSTKEAIEAAKQIGYPVVLKPSHMEQGAGVYAGLETEADLMDSFEKAVRISKSLMVEKHLKGRDYRLNVVNGKLLWAIERIPAGVTGDGVHTIEELIEICNKHEQRGRQGSSALKLMSLDDEVIQVLRSNGLEPNSIPQADLFIPLRRKANISAGGTPVAVMELVHPDNAELAVEVAGYLGLDIAGVDLIMPDISRSWRDVGGGICEVNAQPQLGSVTSAHVYAEILDAMVPNRGKVPTVLVIGEDHNGEVSQYSTKYLKESLRFRVGQADPNYCGVENKSFPLIAESPSLYQAGGQLIMRKDVDALVLSLPIENNIDDGMPTYFIDAVIVIDNEPFSKNGASLDLRKMLESLLPHTTRLLLAFGDKDSSLDLALSRACREIYGIEFRRDGRCGRERDEALSKFLQELCRA